MSGFLAFFKHFATWHSSRSSAGGLLNCNSFGCKKSTGQSKACVCTSWGNAKHTGPQLAGSVMTEMALGSAVKICSARVMRSKYRVTGRKVSLALQSPCAKLSICCNTGSGAREANVSPGNKSTGNRFTCATAAAVTKFVAPGPILVLTAMMRWRNCALLYAIAAKAMPCSLCAR